MPGSALLAEVNGRASPVGHTVMNDLASASWSTVMLSTADTAPAGSGAEARFGAGAVSGRSICWPAPILAADVTPIGPLLGPRVSRTRVGVMATKTSLSPVADGWRAAGVELVLGRSAAPASCVPASTRAPMATTIPNFVPGSAKIWRTPDFRRGCSMETAFPSDTGTTVRGHPTASCAWRAQGWRTITPSHM